MGTRHPGRSLGLVRATPSNSHFWNVVEFFPWRFTDSPSASSDVQSPSELGLYDLWCKESADFTPMRLADDADRRSLKIFWRSLLEGEATDPHQFSARLKLAAYTPTAGSVIEESYSTQALPHRRGETMSSEPAPLNWNPVVDQPCWRTVAGRVHPRGHSVDTSPAVRWTATGRA
jgi:hypothetical protein